MEKTVMLRNKPHTIALINHNYAAQADTEINLVKGQHVKVFDKFENGWWVGENEDGKFGVFPGSYVKEDPTLTNTIATKEQQSSSPEAANVTATNTTTTSATTSSQPYPAIPARTHRKSRMIVARARALYDYAGDSENQLQIKKGDIINVFKKDTDKGWWLGELNNKIGHFPASYVEELSKEENDNLNKEVSESSATTEEPTDIKEKSESEPVKEKSEKLENSEKSEKIVATEEKSTETTKIPDKISPDSIVGIALYDYKGTAEDDLVFRKGDQILLVKTSASSEWRRGVFNGKIGNFPAQYIREIKVKTIQDAKEPIAVALYNFQALDPSELELKKGDMLTVLEQGEPEAWWKGEMDGKVGHFPGNYIRIFQISQLLENLSELQNTADKLVPEHPEKGKTKKSRPSGTKPSHSHRSRSSVDPNQQTIEKRKSDSKSSRPDESDKKTHRNSNSRRSKNDFEEPAASTQAAPTPTPSAVPAAAAPNADSGHALNNIRKIHDELSASEAKFLLALGKEAIRLTNEFRVAENIPQKLEWNNDMYTIGMQHSKDMSEKKLPLGHDGFAQRVKLFPFKYSKAAENVFCCSHSMETPEEYAQLAITSWMNSPGHRKNLLGDFQMSSVSAFGSRADGFFLTQLFVKLKPGVTPESIAVSSLTNELDTLSVHDKPCTSDLPQADTTTKLDSDSSNKDEDEKSSSNMVVERDVEVKLEANESADTPAVVVTKSSNDDLSTTTNNAEKLVSPRRESKKKSKQSTSVVEDSEEPSSSSTTTTTASNKSYVAICNHDAETSGLLVFKKGDAVEVYEQASSGWWKGKANGRVGYFPGTYIKEGKSKARFQVRAKHNYKGRSKNELSFKKGDVFYQIGTHVEGGWARGELNGTVGHFPVSYVEIYQPSTNTTSRDDDEEHSISEQLDSSMRELPNGELVQIIRNLQSQVNNSANSPAVKELAIQLQESETLRERQQEQINDLATRMEQLFAKIQKQEETIAKQQRKIRKASSTSTGGGTLRGTSSSSSSSSKRREILTVSSSAEDATEVELLREQLNLESRQRRELELIVRNLETKNELFNRNLNRLQRAFEEQLNQMQIGQNRLRPTGRDLTQ